MTIYDTEILRLQISTATMELTDIIPLKHEIQLHNCTRPVPSSQGTHYTSITTTKRLTVSVHLKNLMRHPNAIYRANAELIDSKSRR
jgi:hypothetical protein